MTYRFKIETKDSRRIAAMLGVMFPDKLQGLKCLGKAESITLTAQRTPQTRTRQQENYYRKWCNQFASWAGLTPDEMHDEILCITFGTEEVDTKFGIKRRPAKRSGNIKKEEYALLIDQLIITAADIGFAVPPAETDDG